MAKTINSSDRGTVAAAHRDGSSGQHNAAFGIYTGKVMNNIDALKLNRVQLWIPAFGSEETDKDSWVTARPSSPFAGVTPNQGAQNGDFEKVQKAYGMFAPVPDIGSTVVVAFLDGNVKQPVVMNSLFQDNLIHSLPGIGQGTYKDDNGNSVEGPVTEHNHNNVGDPYEQRVRHRVLDDAIKKQGLDADPYRGPSSSTSQRESPSRVAGILTRGQQQFVMDDGDTDGNNRLIRLRTRNGAQLLISDSCGFVYMISKDGNSWLELSNDGNVSIYGAKNFSVRAQGDINLVADHEVNIEGTDVNIRARSSDIRMEAGADFHATAHGDMYHFAEKNANLLVTGSYKETAQKIDMNGPKADEAKPPRLHDLSVNHGFRQSIASSAPESEPWGGHAGCGDGTNKNPSYDTNEHNDRGLSQSSATQVGNNTQSALPSGQQTTLPGGISGLPGVPAIGGQNIAGTLGSVLGSALGLPTDIGTEGVLGVLGRAAANVAGVPASGFINNPKAGAQTNHDRYGEYPNPPMTRTQPPSGGNVTTGSGGVLTDSSGQPVRYGQTESSGKQATTQPSMPNSNPTTVEDQPPRPQNDKACEKGSTANTSTIDAYGLMFTAQNEAYLGVGYLDGAGSYATIGYGRNVRGKGEPYASEGSYQAVHDPNGGWTEEQAWNAMSGYYNREFAAPVIRQAGGPIPQNVLNGIADFCYQHGTGYASSSKYGPLPDHIKNHDWAAAATYIRSFTSDRGRNNLRSQLIMNNCYPSGIISKGTAKFREEKTIQGIARLGSALRNPHGPNGNRGYDFNRLGQNTVGGNNTGDQITMAQARRLLFVYTGDPRPAVADAAKRALGGGGG